MARRSRLLRRVVLRARDATGEKSMCPVVGRITARMDSSRRAIGPRAARGSRPTPRIARLRLAPLVEGDAQITAR